MPRTLEAALELREQEAAERRTLFAPTKEWEWRQSGSGDGSRILSGYAAVYGQETVLYDSSFWCLREVIAPGAFDAVLARKPDVHLTFGHDLARAMARTGLAGVGGLELTSDHHGLRVYARLSQQDPDVQALAAKMDLGVVDQMSFSFTLHKNGFTVVTTIDEHGKETDVRTIHEVAQLYDVCVCAQGAYAQTEANLRSLLATHARERAARAAVPGNTDGGAAVVNPSVAQPDEGASVINPSVNRQLLALRARAQLARIQFKGELTDGKEEAVRHRL